MKSSGGFAIASPAIALAVLAGAMLAANPREVPRDDISTDRRASDEVVQRAYAELRDVEAQHQLRFLEADDPELPHAELTERIVRASANGDVEELERAGLQFFLLDLRVDRKRKAAAEANRCASCHHRMGPGGAGGLVDNFLGDRNPPSLAGASLLEAAVAEISAELAADAAAGRSLQAKGISFGTADNPFGLGKDLVVRPFGRGKWATLDEAIAAMGTEALAVTLSAPERKALRTWIASLPPPVIVPPDSARTPDLYERFARGERRFREVGCATCHVPEITLANGTRVQAFTDFRFHDLGPELADPGDKRRLTAPLWGVAATAPWLHDGRALASLDDAIYAHRGEAEAARTAYIALDVAGRGELKVFLLSLAPAPKIQIAGK